MSSRISRRRFVRTAALGSAGLALSARLRAQTAELPRKPNLLVFLPDQLRADTVVGEKANSVHAPNLHKLALQSVVFERAYVTHPICSPSRSSLLSGTWPHQNRCTSNQGVLPRKFLCLPEMVADSDYHTGYFGKWHLGEEFSAQHGFEEWASIMEYGNRDDWRGAASDYTKFLVSKRYHPDVHKGKYFSKEFGSKLPFELSKPKFLETKACEFLERHGRAPFVMFVAFFEPHPPYNGPFNSEHSLETIQLDATAGDTLGEEIPLRYRLLQEAYRNKLGGPDGYRRTKQNYLGLITEIDHCIGTILAKIEDLGVADRTITVLTSDHGDMMSGHGLLGKQLMYEQSAGVPYLVRVPGISPRHFSQPLSHIDFVPTMLDLLGKPPHPQCAGRSRAKLIHGEDLPPELVFSEWSPNVGNMTADATGYREYGDPIANQQSSIANKEEINRCLGESTRAVVSPDGWKLCLRDRDKNELYNLRDDPDERHNLCYGKDHGDIIAQLTGEIRRWQQRTSDTLKV